MLPPELQCLQILIVYENGYSLNESYSDFKQLSRFFGSFLILTALYLVLLERRGHLHSKVFVVLVKSSKTLSITLTSSVLKLSKLEKKNKSKEFFLFWHKCVTKYSLCFESIKQNTLSPLCSFLDSSALT